MSASSSSFVSSVIPGYRDKLHNISPYEHGYLDSEQQYGEQKEIVMVENVTIGQVSKIVTSGL